MRSRIWPIFSKFFVERKVCSFYRFTVILRILFFLCSLWISPSALASVQLGVGQNNATGGRVVPSLNLGLGSADYEFLGSSTGVSTKAYSHSAYSFAGYKKVKLGDFLFGHIDAGFGFGAIYQYRTFQDLNSAEEVKTDFALGPAFFSRWFVVGPVYFSVEAILGIGNPANRLGDIIGMNFRDQVNFIFGVEL